MKGLIFSITAGQGHNQTAKVLCDNFNLTEDKDGNKIECKYMDVYEYINPMLSETINNIYLMSTKAIPKIYGGAYRIAEMRSGQTDIGVKGLQRLTKSALARKLIDLLKDEDPDFIVCTHIFAALLVTYIKSKHDLRAKTVGIVTDFTIHPYWEDSELDYYVIASEVLIIQGMKKGFPESKFLPIGIPISPKFEKKMNKQEARERLGIEDKPTILVMSGSMGYGNIEKEIVQLDKLDLDFQIAVICGNNKKMKEKIDKLKLSKRIYSFGYVDNVDVFMDACDCMITKPGGLTTSEALAKKIPLIINNPIPGQEDRNVEFLLNAGVAVKASKTFPLDEAVYEMLINNERRILCKQAARFLGKPRSTRNFIEFIKNVCE